MTYAKAHMPTDAYTLIKDLTRRVRNLETVGLGSSLVSVAPDRGIIHTDANGNTLHVADAVSTYQCSSQVANGAVTTTTAAYGLLSGDPVVTVPISSRAQVLVVAGCDLSVVGGSAGAAMSFDLTWAGGSLLANDLRAAQMGAVPVALAFSTAVTRLFSAADGILPNSTVTMRAKYRSDGTNVASFSNRYVFAIPL